MALIWTDGRGAGRQLLALLLAGSAAGAIAPQLTSVAGAAAAPAILGLALVAGGWIGRGRGMPTPGHFILAVLGGALAGLLALTLSPGMATALFGGIVGLALTPRLRGGALSALLRSLPAATGALVFGIIGGALELSPAFGTLGAGAQTSLLAGLLGLGVGVGELTRYVVLTRSEPPVWISDLQVNCGAQTRPLLDAAVDGYRRVVRGVQQANRLDAWDRQETLSLASDLLVAAARSAREADVAFRATLTLSQDAGELEGHEELRKARTAIRESLDEQAQAARREAGKHAAHLTRMATALAERPTPTLHDADELGRRVETIEQRVLVDRVR